MPRIVIVTGSSLCHNPRVWKEASALAAAGLEVEVLGAWLDPSFRERDLELLRNCSFRYTPVIDVTTQKYAWFANRLRFKAGQLWHRQTKWETAWQLGYTARDLFRFARRRTADLFIGHSEPALWVCAKLLDLGFRVGVDMEDWFLEDLPPAARKQRPVSLLRGLEGKGLRGAVHATCTSQAMSVALASEYSCRPPTVIYNAFPWSERQSLDGQIRDRIDRGLRSVHWFSQTLGPGRGLEDLFRALPMLNEQVEVHLRGTMPTGGEAWLQGQLPEEWRHRVFVHPLVRNEELLSRIAEHDVGFAGEQPEVRSRDLTVTNKILQYLLGGLAVVATDTAGQREIAAQAQGAVLLYPAGDAVALAQRLSELLASPERLVAAKAAALHAAENTFCWERCAPRLLESVELALAT